MSELKIGDRVRTISVPTASKLDKSRITIGMKGTVKEVKETKAGVEFDSFMGGHKGNWNGINGHCWYLESECLEKIKIETMEQKILETLRKEIGVEVGEEFDVYENGEKQWTCKFDEVGFSHEIDDEFRESGLWKQIVCKFHSYQFKKKPFVPKYGEDYFFLTINNRCNDNKNIFFGVKTDTWVGVGIDYGRLALRNVFKSSSEALENRDKLKERLNELRRGE